MTRRLLVTTALSLLLLGAGGLEAAGKGEPKPIEPAQTLKPKGMTGGPEGYFDDVFGLDRAGKMLAVIRTDGASFAKLEIYDVATAKLTTSFDLPGTPLLPASLEPLPDGSGAVLVAREKPDDAAPVFAFGFASGKPVVKVGPTAGFERPPADGTPRANLLIGVDRKLGKGAEATFTLTPYTFATLAPYGKSKNQKIHKIDASGQLGTPPVRFVGFFDGYTRILGERPGAYDKSADVRKPSRKVVVDALSGKVLSEGEISDVPGWAVSSLLRRQHPDRSVFVELNQDGSGVDVVDAMGKQRPATLPVPFRLYDIKSLLVEEGPAPGGLTFGLGLDPLNPDAIKRQKADLPMLDVYNADAEQGTVTLRGRVFTPRPVTWRMRADKLVVLKRFKSFSRGGDELQVFDLK